MIEVASVYPAGARLEVWVVGVILFIAVATCRGRQRVPTAPVVVLSALVTVWLFAASLLWGRRWPTSVRLDVAWKQNPGAWEWALLIVFAIAGALAVAALLRAVAMNRPRAVVLFGVTGFVLFVCWSVVARVPVGVAVVGAVLALVAVSRATAPVLDGGSSAEGTMSLRRAAALPLTIMATAVALTLVGVWFVSTVPTS